MSFLWVCVYLKHLEPTQTSKGNYQSEQLILSLFSLNSDYFLVSYTCFPRTLPRTLHGKPVHNLLDTFTSGLEIRNIVPWVQIHGAVEWLAEMLC